MNRIILTLLLVLLVITPAWAVGSLDNSPYFPKLNKTQKQKLPSSLIDPKTGHTAEQKLLVRNDQVWRLPNGYEEFYMVLALATGDKQWCDRMSLESQIRKVDARPGVQIIKWRDICLIETAAFNQNPVFCRFVRGEYIDALDGREFNQQYCQTNMSMASNYTYERPIHWLQTNPYEYKFLSPQAILTYLGFTEQDLVSQDKQGLYQKITKSSWEDLFKQLLFPEFVNRRDANKFDQMVKRASALPDFSTASTQPADRYLRYTGTSVRLPGDCYENPTAEYTCRMLECLNVRDIISCRKLAETDDIKKLNEIFLQKCLALSKDTDSGNATQQCRKELEIPFNKVFFGPPESFLPYLVRQE